MKAHAQVGVPDALYRYGAQLHLAAQPLPVRLLGPVQEHAELHGAIEDALLAEGIDLLDCEHDMAAKVMDVLVVRGVIAPPDGYTVVDGRIEASP